MSWLTYLLTYLLTCLLTYYDLSRAISFSIKSRRYTHIATNHRFIALMLWDRGVELQPVGVVID